MARPCTLRFRPHSREVGLEQHDERGDVVLGAALEGLGAQLLGRGLRGAVRLREHLVRVRVRVRVRVGVRIRVRVRVGVRVGVRVRVRAAWSGARLGRG